MPALGKQGGDPVQGVEEAKRAETRERRIARAVELLREGKKSPR